MASVNIFRIRGKGFYVLRFCVDVFYGRLLVAMHIMLFNNKKNMKI